MRRRRAGLSAAIVIAAVVGGIGFVAPAQAAPAQPLALGIDFPSWSDVQAAKGNAAAVQAEYQKVTAAIQGLQSAVDTTASDELMKQAAYTVAAQAATAAAAKAKTLTSQAKSAARASTNADKRYGALVSQLYVTGGTSVTSQLLLGSGEPGDLLKKLGSMNQLTVQSSQLHTLALQKANVASGLASQAAAARTARDAAQKDASTKLAAAQNAAAAAQQALTAQQQQSQTLYQQAAALKNTAVSVQQNYYKGVAYRQALAKQQAEQAAQRAQQAAQNGDPTRLYIIAQGLNPDPAAAQAYARGAIGSYGWGASQFTCLQQLWTIESGWRVNAYNPSSAAYGIPQALPATKMAVYGSDWMTNANTQINWGLAYIKSSYGSPCAALHFETSHVPYWY